MHIVPLVVKNDFLIYVAKHIPWDSEIFGFNVAEVCDLQIGPEQTPEDVLNPLFSWFEQNDIEFAYCKVKSNQIRESMMLESHKFHFIETVLHPHISDLSNRTPYPSTLVVSKAESRDVEEIARIAQSSFENERYHLDPRIDSTKASARYARWAISSLHQSRYELLVVRGSFSETVAFFAVERMSQTHVEWRLTAMAPEFRGRKLAVGVWESVIEFHRCQGVDSVATSITARNSRVLNLYSKLDFRFTQPEVTLHWMRN